MPEQFDLNERERRAEVARGLEMGNLFCAVDALLDRVGNHLNTPPVKRVSWWYRYRFRILILAALAALILSGSRLH